MKLNNIYFNDFTKINYHKVKLQLIFNPAEQASSLWESMIFVSVRMSRKRNPNLFTLLIIPLPIQS
jgi:hypothetical protein